MQGAAGDTAAALTLVWLVSSGVAVGLCLVITWLWRKHTEIYNAIKHVELELINLELKIAHEYAGTKSLELVRVELRESIEALSVRLETETNKVELKESIESFGTRLETAIHDWHNVMYATQKGRGTH